MIDTVVDSNSTDIQWFYSLTSRQAVGYRHMQFASAPKPLHLAQVNLLAKRWNKPDSQANIYVMTGIGVQDETLSPYLGAETDWESRRFYIAGIAEQFWTDTPSTKLKLRAGVAPYVAELDSLHTWFILQATQMSAGEESEQWVLPMIRLFKGNVLTEFGSNGNVHFMSFRVHF